MDSTPTQPVARHNLALEAEGLLRCLAGVSHARVTGSAGAIDHVHVTAADPDVARSLAGHVRSALLAGLATPVTPARIHVRVLGKTDAPAHAHRFRLLDAIDDLDTDEPDRTDPEPAAPRPVDLPRLLAVDLERRDDGRTLCRVAIAFRAGVHGDQALAVDLPGATVHATAHAVVRALVNAGVHGLTLDGTSQVEIAGHQHVVVALRRVDRSTRVRSASAHVSRSAERAAAIAAITAAQELT